MFHPRDVLRRPHLSEDAPNPKPPPFTSPTVFPVRPPNGGGFVRITVFSDIRL